MKTNVTITINLSAKLDRCLWAIFALVLLLLR